MLESVMKISKSKFDTKLPVLSGEWEKCGSSLWKKIGLSQIVVGFGSRDRDVVSTQLKSTQNI